MYEEKREYPRVLVDERLYGVLDTGESFYCKTRDISAKGITIETPHEAKVGSEFEIELDFEELDEVLKARGRVIRNWKENEQWLAGITLLGMDNSDFLDLLDFTLSKVEKND